MNSIFQQSLVLMLKGMVGIFTVIILIYVVIVILNAISKRNKRRNAGIFSMHFCISSATVFTSRSAPAPRSKAVSLVSLNPG